MKNRKNDPKKPPILDPESTAPIITDPQGCYTGRPMELYETPVQDADDL